MPELLAINEQRSLANIWDGDNQINFFYSDFMGIYLRQKLEGKSANVCVNSTLSHQ